jgi:hypothetical protein
MARTRLTAVFVLACVATQAAPKNVPVGPKIPDFEQCVAKRDYLGAVTLLEFKRQSAPKVRAPAWSLPALGFRCGQRAPQGQPVYEPSLSGGCWAAGVQDKTNLEWLGYCHFHSGEHKKALDAYTELLHLGDADGPDPLYHTYSAACHFYLANYKEAEAEALKVRVSVPLPHPWARSTPTLSSRRTAHVRRQRANGGAHCAVAEGTARRRALAPSCRRGYCSTSRTSTTTRAS